MNSIQQTGLLIIIGSLVFVLSAFAMPNINRIYMESSATEKIHIIEDHPGTWIFHNIMFLLGSTITALSLVILSSHLENIRGHTWFWLGSIIILVAVIPWDWHLILRITSPEGFVRNALPGWLFVSFTIFTLVGLGLLGVGFLQSPFPLWLAWLHIIGAGLLLMLFILLKDMPPFVYYLFTSTTGIVSLQQDTLLKLTTAITSGG